jgi:hypothetical protein
VAFELFSGAVGGREGTFVLHHRASSGGPTRLLVVPGSGTGDLGRITGSARIEGDRPTLDYDLGRGWLTSR